MQCVRTYRWLILAVVLLLATTAIFELTPLDIQVQDHFFSFDAGTWLVDEDNPLLRLIFYSGIKAVIIGVGALSILGVALSFTWKKILPLRQGLVIFILSLALVPLLVAGSKKFTNVYCPYQIQRYDGVYPYVKLFERYPEDFHPKRKGRCFPAGHATGGFAFMALYCVFRKRWTRIAGASTGLVLGWTMGLYQMFKGAHYLSHTVATMLLAWIIIYLIQAGITALTTKKGFAWLSP